VTLTVCDLSARSKALVKRAKKLEASWKKRNVKMFKGFLRMERKDGTGGKPPKPDTPFVYKWDPPQLHDIREMGWLGVGSYRLGLA